MKHEFFSEFWLLMQERIYEDAITFIEKETLATYKKISIEEKKIKRRNAKNNNSKNG